MSYFNPEDIENFFNQKEEIPSRDELINSIQHNAEIRSMLNSLAEHAGFKYLMENVRAQMFRRIAENLERPDGVDGAVKMMYVNGEIAGIKLALDFVNITLDTAKTNIETANKLNEAYYPDETEQEDGTEE